MPVGFLTCVENCELQHAFTKVVNSLKITEELDACSS